MSEEREPPKVFGREMSPTGFPGKWSVTVGIFTFTMTYPCAPSEDIQVNILASRYICAMFTDESDAIEWFETTARQVMRECSEVAGPMVAVKDLGSNHGAFENVTLEDWYPVRFK